jgi:methylmalonyl-CoA decarboxylase
MTAAWSVRKSGSEWRAQRPCDPRHAAVIPESERMNVTSAIENDIGTITLDHPRRHNALSEAIVGELIAGLVAMEAAHVRVVVLRAAPGAKVWSAGHDVNELPAGGRDPLGWDDPLRHLVRTIENFPCPVIAMIEGGVWGGACEVVLACDLVIAAPTATFALTPARLGVPYNVSGMMTFMNSANIRIIKEMAFTAQPMAAERAERVGMINHLVSAQTLAAFTYDTAHVIAANSPLSIRVMKEQLRVLTGAYPLTPRGFERIQGLRRVVYDSEDYREGISAFKEKRQPSFTGS